MYGNMPLCLELLELLAQVGDAVIIAGLGDQLLLEKPIRSCDHAGGLRAVPQLQEDFGGMQEHFDLDLIALLYELI
jgi:hypothetical protein